MVQLCVLALIVLVRVFHQAQRTSLRPLGTTEEYKELNVLLQDIVCRMDNWKKMSEEAKAKLRAKIQGIVTYGELMRRLAMDELGEEDQEEEGTGDGRADNTGVDSSESPIHGRKRAMESASHRSHKPGKRENLSVVPDGIASAIERSVGDATIEYDCLRERLHFEREDAAKKLALE